MRDFVQLTVLLLYHIILHSLQKQREQRLGKSPTWWPKDQRTSLGMLQSHVSTAARLLWTLTWTPNSENSRACAPPRKKIKNCTCLLRARARRINFGHVLCCHSQGMISASQYAHCSNAEAASVILILFTTLTQHASTLTVVNMGSRKENWGKPMKL